MGIPCMNAANALVYLSESLNAKAGRPLHIRGERRPSHSNSHPTLYQEDL